MTEKTQTHTKDSGTPASVETLDRVAKSLHKGIDAVAEDAHPTVKRVAAGAHKAVDHSDEVAHLAVGAIDKASVKSDQMLAASTRYMRDHPLLTVGLAMSAGYVLSRLLASR